MSVEEERISRFEEAVRPQLDSAHNLARWLTGSDADAGDVVQEACVRALRYFDGFHGGEVRPWFMAIVRNCAYTQLGRRPRTEELLDGAALADARGGSIEAELEREDERAALGRALEGLAPEFREAIVLRELEGLSYKEISAVTGAPIGTVMSRLSRARLLLLKRLGGSEGVRS
ncbi:MAG TPA: sigma-70 family RNA polymerase sigma factor [Elusimicrobiota bacterium]|nr:sigma-70 family RNA polymerase sigma factor [Elusimicrobiota bacterium]